MCKGATVFILNNKRNPSRRPKMNATNPENCFIYVPYLIMETIKAQRQNITKILTMLLLCV